MLKNQVIEIQLTLEIKVSLISCSSVLKIHTRLIVLVIGYPLFSYCP